MANICFSFKQYSWFLKTTEYVRRSNYLLYFTFLLYRTCNISGLWRSFRKSIIVMLQTKMEGRPCNEHWGHGRIRFILNCDALGVCRDVVPFWSRHWIMKPFLTTVKIATHCLMLVNK